TPQFHPSNHILISYHFYSIQIHYILISPQASYTDQKKEQNLNQNFEEIDLIFGSFQAVYWASISLPVKTHLNKCVPIKLLLYNLSSKTCIIIYIFLDHSLLKYYRVHFQYILRLFLHPDPSTHRL